ncbi:MAG TPA: CocE/NonD family hydrolase, partial [Baekduia sp.]|nr:CocE/NonD family hydrolase [Baekduia sp.]
MGRSLGRAAVIAAAMLGVCAGGVQAKGLTVRGSAEQVLVTGAQKGQRVVLSTAGGKRVAAQRAGSLGGAVFRNVKPGTYRLGGHKVKVLSQRSTPPSTKAYNQKIPSSGYGYLTTRDGTKLAIAVRLPAGGKAPYPTLVEYSGYGYANPAGGESSIAQIAQLLGYAVVDVNMRGTGCSGGSFDYFEPLQGLDGYDIV